MNFNEEFVKLHKKILEATPHKTATVRLLTSLLTNHPSKTKTCWGHFGKQGRTHKFSFGLLHKDTPVLADLQGLTFVISTLTLDAV